MGAVFLPAAGVRSGSDVDDVQDYGYYWSATEDYIANDYCLYFYLGGAGMDDDNSSDGQSVRLVKDL